MASPDDIDRELDAFMSELENSDRLRVDCVLKESPFEVTQRVSELREDGSRLGPFIRKIFPGNADTREIGSAYNALFDAQNAGARFAHLPRILQVTDTVDSLVVIMEYVSGTTLRNLIESHPDERADITRAVFPLICDAASELHEGLDDVIIHRDITPSNIICTGDGIIPVSAVLVDFGIARTHKPDSTADTTHFGTAAYAAPEQYGYGQTDVRTDTYALGATLAFCLTGIDPNPGSKTTLQAANGVSPAMRAVIEKATAFDPGARFASAQELREAFLAAAQVEDKTVNAKPSASIDSAEKDGQSRTASSEEIQPKTHRSTKQIVAFASIALVLLAALAVILWNTAGISADRASSAATSSSSSASSSSAASTPAATSSSSSAGNSAQHETPVISEYGYSQDEYGTTWYGVAITNPSTDETIVCPTLHVSGTDEAGTIVVSKDQVFGFIQPGETVYFGEPLDTSQAPSQMTCSLDTKSAQYQAAEDGPSFSCTNLSESTDDLATHFRGEIDIEGTLPENTGIQLVVILRDESGKIVAGYNTYPSVPDGAHATTFDMTWPAPPAYSSWEAHATRWL